MSAPGLLLGALPLSWLVSNHYPPWLAAWAEGLALALLLGAALLTRYPVAVPKAWGVALALALGSVAGQAGFKADVFGGDLWMAALYLCALGLAIATGFAAQAQGLKDQSAEQADNLAPLALGLVAAGITSVGLASVQWLGIEVSSLYVLAVPPGGRPFGSFAQPNHFCTACFLALAALLLLRQWGRVGAVGFWLGAIWLASGMVMSGSRTGWLQMAVLLVATAFQTRRLPLQLRIQGASLVVLYFAALSMAWPTINTALDQAPVRSAAKQLEAGSRMTQWTALADAVAQAPLTGYGWGRVSAAQLRVAADHPAPHSMFDHSHNIVLDWVLWTGLPMGAAFIGLVGYWLFSRARACSSPTAHLWMLALLGLLVHGLLEYPLEYAYFLMPAGLMMGAVESLHRSNPSTATGLRNARPWPLPLWAVRAAALALLALLGVVAWDYLRAEEGYRTMRFETARIGTHRVTPPPQLRVLTQLQAYQEFVQTTARPEMSAEELTTFRRMSERFPTPPVLLRYALAMGLNGEPATAARTLVSLCHMHPWERCAEAREAWPALQAQYPQLLAVPVPLLVGAPAKIKQGN